MKPLAPAYHQILADWVCDGGKLLYVGDEQDPFQHIPAWWNNDGVTNATPLEDLIARLTGAEHSEWRKAHSDGSLSVGKGAFITWAIDPAAIAEDSQLADTWVEKVSSALALTADPEPVWLVRRGPYIAGMYLAQDATQRTLPGQYVDLTRGDLSISENPILQPDQPSLWYDLAFTTDPGAVEIVASSVPLCQQETASSVQVSYRIDAPTGTPGAARIKLPAAPSSLVIHEQEAIRPVRWQWHEQSHTVYCSFTWNSDNAQLVLRMHE